MPLQELRERMRTVSSQSEHPAIIVEEVVTAVLDEMDGRLSPTETLLLSEIADLGRIIEQAKAEIAECSVDEIRARYLPSATDELDAIVQHTASATDSILESCEALDTLANSLTGDQAGVLQSATTKIYEACSFQDITGQRITKVVKALKAIEGKVVRLKVLSVAAGAGTTQPDDEPEEVSLLNGPALPHAAMGQDDIDKLLADF